MRPLTWQIVHQASVTIDGVSLALQVTDVEGNWRLTAGWDWPELGYTTIGTYPNIAAAFRSADWYAKQWSKATAEARGVGL